MSAPRRPPRRRPTGPPWPYLLLAIGIGLSGYAALTANFGLAGFATNLLAVALVLVAQQSKNGKRE